MKPVRARSRQDETYFVVCGCIDCKDVPQPRQRKLEHRDKPRWQPEQKREPVANGAGPKEPAPANDPGFADFERNVLDAHDRLDFSQLNVGLPAAGVAQPREAGVDQDPASDDKEGDEDGKGVPQFETWED